MALDSTNSKVAYSEDGFSWNFSKLPTDSGLVWLKICYGDGMFVAVGLKGSVSVYAYSTNGFNWIEKKFPANTSIGGICYGNGKFVVVGGYYDGAKYIAAFLYSTDGINWNMGSSETVESWPFENVCYGNGKFVAIPQGSNKAEYSTNGINWYQITEFQPGLWRSICYGKGRFVVLHELSVPIYSINVINWNDAAVFPVDSGDYMWSKICYGEGKFVAFCYDEDIVNGGYIGISVYSTDAINWYSKTGFPFGLGDVCYGNGIFVGTDVDGNGMAYSTDGINWTKIQGVDGNWDCISYGFDSDIFGFL